MVYCSVACCTNDNHNRQDLSYFVFPFDARLKKWIKFCDKRFAIEATKAKAGKPNILRICSAHFVLESYKRTLNGRREILQSALPTIFKPSEKRSPRDVRYESVRKKRRLNDDIKTSEPCLRVDINKENHPVKGAELVVTWCDANVQAIQHDHSYCFVAENAETERASISDLKDTKPKKVNSVSCQTGITMCRIEELEEQLKTLKATLADKSRLKKEFFLEDVMKNDDSVKFYTGIPTLGCLNMLVDLITTEADKLKYWDNSKDKKN